ncbi:hypothetical protein [Bacillus sp. FJAT-44742]|uniref:hypothetical protein n=1 Tax=Bacillus sp. FJAT-44742 TaxID=2014005 RepID=UPI000C244427|nr:hypothetical protein [Bacillus sp. FJAT-44742]
MFSNKKEGNVKEYLKPIRSREEKEKKLLQKAARLEEKGKLNEAIEYVDQAIEAYVEHGHLSKAFAAYQKKGSYLYQAGRKEESWNLYQELEEIYQEDDLILPQVYDEMRKQCEDENRFTKAFEMELLATLFTHRSQLLQNQRFHEDTFKIDRNWEENERCMHLAEQAGIDWQPIQTYLREAYKGIDAHSDFAGIYKDVKKQFLT